MLEQQLPIAKRPLEVTPAPVRIILAEEGASRLSAILPPLEELREIRLLSEKNFSLKQVSHDNHIRLRDDLKFQLDRLLEKEERFGSSPTYLTHVADIHEMLGEITDAQERLQAAARLSPNPLLRHRLGANFLTLGKTDDALALFSSMDLSTDVHANLRLAYLSARDDRIDDATTAVDNALLISPTDFGARLFRGALALAKGEASRAIQNFKFALEERPSVAAYTNLAISYVLVRRPDKAFSALKKAIALEPYNEHAVGLLADLAFLEKRNDLAIAPLERFVEFEQKSEAGWERLARALIESGQKRKGIAALKRQASVQESSHVFNNLGVAHARLGDRPKAMQYFRHAMEIANSEDQNAVLLPSRNLISVLCEAGDYLPARHVAQAILKRDPDCRLATDSVSSDIYALYVSALVRSGERKEAVRLSKRILKEVPNAVPGLRVWLAASLIAEFGMTPEKFEEALAIGRNAIEESVQLDRNDHRRLALHNNIAFLLLEMGRLPEAEKHLAQLSNYIHVDAYATATVGLLHFKRGHVERAHALYDEAMRLAISSIDRRRIAQKLNFELGSALLEKDPRQARRRLLMAAKDTEPIAQISEKARQMLLRLK
ncbi:MAG: hypothetical protein A3H93_14620 [Rhodocyclales bacterium RIFCSPLOWO2_02_FULL_63_24]|nr:MAG: hypothetical protein A3H93_14620 [Rhodocyclales bacterium RIFCSPLOWO2_02_FULL_63_24]